MSYSESLFQEARDYIPGGVNSPVRAFKSVGGAPLFISKAKGPYIYDVDGNEYIDYVGSWGPMILGHANEKVVQAVKEQAEKGLSYGAPCEIELRLAEKICELMPNIEKVRLVNSGTEATMTAIRLARGFTGRNKIIKFAGCYHGHADCLLVNAGSGALTLGVPSSPGVPKATAADTLTAQFNDFHSVETLFAEHAGDIAAIIVEPIAGNMNMILPQDHFLEKLRDICDQYKSILIFDEVMTGFRVALQGAQSIYKVKPDITTLGKVIGGGMPVGALGGRADIMNYLAPEGPVYQAGTLSGNPLAAAAGLATLNQLTAPDFFAELEKKTEELVSGILRLAKTNNVNMVGHFKGGMFGFFFTNADDVTDYAQTTACDQARFKLFFHAMLGSGVYLAPSSYEAGFVSIAHAKRDIAMTLQAVEAYFTSVKF